jgi:hypothetical protein
MTLNKQRLVLIWVGAACLIQAGLCAEGMCGTGVPPVAAAPPAKEASLAKPLSVTAQTQAARQDRF